MKLILFSILALIAVTNALPRFSNELNNTKNLRNFQQFIIHHLNPSDFIEHYVAWSIISVTGHHLLDDDFDKLFDKLSLSQDSKIQQAVVVLQQLREQVDIQFFNNDYDYDNIVSEAIAKIKLILSSY